jgi:GNAT superfamily N-acetyltransferase
MRIELATASHAPFIVDAQRSMARETEDLVLDPATVHAGVDAVFQGGASGFYVVALRDTSPIACALVLSEWSDWRNGTVWWIHSVFVVPEERRNGAFRAIFTFLETRARQEGIRGLRLYVDRRNTAAQAVYRTLGMTNDHYELFEKML